MAVSYNATSFDAGSAGINPLVLFYALIGAGLFVLCAVLLYQILQEYRYEKGKISRSVNMVLLQILVPKKSSRDEEESKKDPKDLVARASQMFSSLYSIADTQLNKSWYKKGAHVSFEIASIDGVITFYVAVPQELVDLVEKQIHSFYPDAYMEEVERYNIFSDTTKVQTAELTLSDVVSLPIKTYKEFETDTLNTITSSLSKLASGEAASIQFLIRPAKNTWHKGSEFHIKQLQEGKKISGGDLTWKKIGEGSLSFGKTLASAASKTEEYKEEKQKTLSPITEQKIKMIGEKASLVGFETVIRVVVASPEVANSKMHLANILSSFTVFNSPTGNKLIRVKGRSDTQITQDFIFRAMPYDGSKSILNCDELASLFHLPNRNTETPSIKWLTSKRAPAPPEVPKEGLYLGTNIFRGVRTPVYMRPEDRMRHMYVIGKSGTGKSTFIEDLCVQDIRAGRGVCYIDPHGESIDRILQQIPRERAEDVIIFNPGDYERPMGLNLLEFNSPEERSLAVSELMNVFDKLYDLKSTGGPMFEQYFRNAALLVMEDVESGSTLMEIPKVLSDEDFRAYKISKCQNPIIKNYWLKEAEKAGGEAALANVVPYVTSKMTKFIANDIMRPIIAQQKSAFNVREIMDNQKILLLNLSKGRIGEENMSLLGLIMVSKIYLAAMSRADMKEADRKTFYLYMDEFQNFSTKAVADILSEARKYGLALTVAHQYIGQLTQNNNTQIHDAVFGNAGTMVSFRIGVDDAEEMAKVYDPVFSVNDLINVEAFNSYIKLLANNTSLRAFSLNHFKDMSKVPPPNQKLVEAITQLSRLKYGRDRDIVEEEIRLRAG
ncbi:MAG: type IV secretion system DNA-binding domain-containing protein [Patescibacteria group bacterium]